MTRTVHLLLDAEGIRREGDRGAGFALATAAGLVHLFLCGVAEPYLPGTTLGFVWLEFFAAESALWTVISGATFGGLISPLLIRTRLLPVSPADRYLFTLTAMMRQNLLRAVLASGILFLAVHFRSAPLVALSACGVFALDAIALHALLALAMLLLLKARAPLAATLIVCTFLGVSWVLGSSVLGTEGLLSALPIVGWSVDGLTGILAGNPFRTLGDATITALLGGIAFLAGRRWA
jgi:hypothetical protein